MTQVSKPKWQILQEQEEWKESLTSTETESNEINKQKSCGEVRNINKERWSARKTKAT